MVCAAFAGEGEWFYTVEGRELWFSCWPREGLSFFEAPNAMLRSAPDGGVTASTGLLAAERHAGVWTPVIAHKTISAEPQFALAA